MHPVLCYTDIFILVPTAFYHFYCPTFGEQGLYGEARLHAATLFDRRCLIAITALLEAARHVFGINQKSTGAFCRDIQRLCEEHLLLVIGIYRLSILGRLLHRHR